MGGTPTKWAANMAKSSHAPAFVRFLKSPMPTMSGTRPAGPLAPARCASVRSLFEVCDVVEVTRDLGHPAPASSCGQKHIAGALHLGDCCQGFALLCHHHPIL